jgi:hypothetical protein
MRVSKARASGPKEEIWKWIRPGAKQSTVIDRIWRVIRAKMVFRVEDLIILAGAKRETVRWYIKTLRHAGFVRPAKAVGRGVEWRLLRDPGPKRPHIVKTKTVHCQGKAIHCQGKGHTLSRQKSFPEPESELYFASKNFS